MIILKIIAGAILAAVVGPPLAILIVLIWVFFSALFEDM